MTPKEKIEFIKKFYKDMPDEVFKERMQKAGFEIVEGMAGQIIFDNGDK